MARASRAVGVEDHMIRNLTPHEITIQRTPPLGQPALPPLVLPSEGVARCSTERRPVYTAAMSIALTEQIHTEGTVFGPVEGLPEPVDGVLLVVSGLVLDHPSTAHRTDLAAPGELVRDPQGRPIGCRGLRLRVDPDPYQLVCELRRLGRDALREVSAGIDNENRSGCAAASVLDALFGVE